MSFCTHLHMTIFIKQSPYLSIYISNFTYTSTCVFVYSFSIHVSFGGGARAAATKNAPGRWEFGLVVRSSGDVPEPGGPVLASTWSPISEPNTRSIVEYLPPSPVSGRFSPHHRVPRHRLWTKARHRSALFGLSHSWATPIHVLHTRSIWGAPWGGAKSGAIVYRKLLGALTPGVAEWLPCRPTRG